MIVNNSTRTTIHYHHHHYHGIDSKSAITEILPAQYDSAGAAIFIIVVLLWFSLGIVCMLGVQIRARAETLEDCARRRAKLFIITLRDQTQKKQILGIKYFSIYTISIRFFFSSEELVDKEKRDKLWDIYLGKTETNKDKLNRADLLRIRNIQKQLAVINRNRLIMNDTLATPATRYLIPRSSSESRSTFISHLSAMENSAYDRRRLSLDQQIIERWKSIDDPDKTLEQCSTGIRKRSLRRHFRRSDKNSPQELKAGNTTMTDLLPNHERSEAVDDEERQLFPRHKSSDHQSRPLRKKSNDLLNPYITYFHLPINEKSQSNIENLPLVTIKSDHHIIQICDDECQC